MAVKVVLYDKIFSSKNRLHRVANDLSIKEICAELNITVSGKHFWLGDTAVADINQICLDKETLVIRTVPQAGLSTAAIITIGVVAVLPSLYALANNIVTAATGISLSDRISYAFGQLFSSMSGSPGSVTKTADKTIASRPDISGASNSMGTGQKWPIILGKRLVSPYMAGSYWTEVSEGDDGLDTYLHGLLVVGYGPLLLRDFKLGDMRLGVGMTLPADGNFDCTLTPDATTSGGFLTSLDSVQLEIKQSVGAMNPALYGNKIFEEQLTYNMMWADVPDVTTEAAYLASLPARMSARGVKQVSMTISAQGFCHFDSSGNILALSDTFTLLWRDVCEVGHAANPWNTFADATAVKTVSGIYRTEIRYTLTGTYTGDKEQIEFSVRRGRKNNVDVGSNSYLDTWVCTSARTITDVEPIAVSAQEKLCRIAFRIKATEKMSGNLDQLSCIASSVLPSMNPLTGVWPAMHEPTYISFAGNLVDYQTALRAVRATWAETSNPADLFLAAFRGVWARTGTLNLNACQTADTRFAWDKFQDLWRWCNEPKDLVISVDGVESTIHVEHQCAMNYVVLDGMRVSELIDAILAVARAKKQIDGSRYSLSHDALYNVVPAYTDANLYNNLYNQQIPVGVISPRNSRGLVVSKAFKKVPDAAIVTIISEVDYKEVTFTIRNPLITAEQLTAKIIDGSVLYEQLSIPGITTVWQATLYARYIFAAYITRITTCTCTVDIEQFFCSVGSLANIASDVLLTGLMQGRIRNVELSGTDYIITTDVDCIFNTADTFATKIWSIQTSDIVEVACTPLDSIAIDATTARTKKWAVTQASVSSYTDLLEIDSYIAIGISGRVTRDYILVAKELDENYGAKLSFIESAEAVHTAEVSTVPMPNLLTTPPIRSTSVSAARSTKAEQSIGSTGPTLLAAMSRIKTVISGAPDQTPDTVTNITAIAGIDTIICDWADPSAGLRGAIANYQVSVSKDAGATWSTYTVSKSNFIYTFDRDVDGYPEASALAQWRVRIKAVNIYGYASTLYGPSTAGQIVDTTAYGSWIPAVPNLTLSKGSSRIVNASWSVGNGYGQNGIELQVQAGYTILPSLEIETKGSPDATWYEPAIGIDPYTSTDNYRLNNTADGKLFRQGSNVSLPVPLYGQNLTPVASRPTPYFYRIRACSDVPTTAAPSAKSYSAWSSFQLIDVTATSAQDIVRAWNLNDQGEKVKIDGALGVNQIYVEMLAAITANLGVITDGAFTGSVTNMWAISRIMEDDGITVKYYEGTVSMGGTDQYLHVEPRKVNGVVELDQYGKVANYDISFKVGNFSVDATGSVIKGIFTVQTDAGGAFFEVDAANYQVNIYTSAGSAGKSLSFNDLDLVIKDTLANGHAELARLGYDDDTGLWGGDKLGGEVAYSPLWTNSASKLMNGAVVVSSKFPSNTDTMRTTAIASSLKVVNGEYSTFFVQLEKTEQLLKVVILGSLTVYFVTTTSIGISSASDICACCTSDGLLLIGLTLLDGSARIVSFNPITHAFTFVRTASYDVNTFIHMSLIEDLDGSLLCVGTTGVGKVVSANWKDAWVNITTIATCYYPNFPELKILEIAGTKTVFLTYVVAQQMIVYARTSSQPGGPWFQQTSGSPAVEKVSRDILPNGSARIVYESNKHMLQMFSDNKTFTHDETLSGYIASKAVALANNRVLLMFRTASNNLKEQFIEADGTYTTAVEIKTATVTNGHAICVFGSSRVLCVYVDVNYYLRCMRRNTDAYSANVAWADDMPMISTAYTGYSPALTLLADGTVLCVYANASGLCQMIYNPATYTWSAQVIIQATVDLGYAPALSTNPDGSVLLLYNVGFQLFERTRSAAGVWGSAIARSIPILEKRDSFYWTGAYTNTGTCRLCNGTIIAVITFTSAVLGYVKLFDITANAHIAQVTLAFAPRSIAEVPDGYAIAGATGFCIIDRSGNFIVAPGEYILPDSVRFIMFADQEHILTIGATEVTSINMNDYAISTTVLPAATARYATCLVDGVIYVAQYNAPIMERIRLSDGALLGTVTIPSANRATMCAYNGKIYMPRSGATILDIYDISTNTVASTLSIASTVRVNCFAINGLIIIPRDSTGIIDIYDPARALLYTYTLTSTATPSQLQQCVASGAYMYSLAGNLDVVDFSNIAPTISTQETGMSTIAFRGGKIMTRSNILSAGSSTSFYRAAAAIIGCGKYLFGYSKDVGVSGALWRKDLQTGVTIAVDIIRASSSDGSAYGGTLYLPESDSTVLSIISGSASLSIRTKTITAATRFTCCVHRGKLFMPRDNGTVLDVLDLATEALSTVTIPSAARCCCCAYNNRLYLPRSNGTILDMYTIGGAVVSTVALPSAVREACCAGLGLIFMPRSGGTVLDIYSIVTNVVTSTVVLPAASRKSSYYSNGQVFMPRYDAVGPSRIIDVYDVVTGLVSQITSYVQSYYGLGGGSHVYNDVLYTVGTNEVSEFTIPHQMTMNSPFVGNRENTVLVKKTNNELDLFYNELGTTKIANAPMLIACDTRSPSTSFRGDGKTLMLALDRSSPYYLRAFTDSSYFTGESGTKLAQSGGGFNSVRYDPVTGKKIYKLFDGSEVSFDSGTEPLRYAQNLFTDVLNTSSTTYVDVTGFSVTLTPRTNLIKISFRGIFGMSGSASGYARLVKDGIPINSGRVEPNFNPHGSASFYGGSADGNNNEETSCVMIVPSIPNVSTIIKVQFCSPQAAVIYVNNLGSNAGSVAYSCRCMSMLLAEEYNA